MIKDEWLWLTKMIDKDWWWLTMIGDADYNDDLSYSDW